MRVEERHVAEVGLRRALTAHPERDVHQDAAADDVDRSSADPAGSDRDPAPEIVDLVQSRVTVGLEQVARRPAEAADRWR